MSEKLCNHKWGHLTTHYKYELKGYCTSNYTRMDRFFCEKCCEIKEVIKSENATEKPIWWERTGG